MATDLKQDVFEPVLKRVKLRIDSVQNIRRFSRVGIEGWFKVEIVAALGLKVASIKNKGPDLELQDGTFIELKAATSFEKGWIISPLQKYDDTSVLFLVGESDPTKVINNKDGVYEIVGLEVISDGMNEWLLGMVKRSV